MGWPGPAPLGLPVPEDPGRGSEGPGRDGQVEPGGEARGLPTGRHKLLKSWLFIPIAIL